MYLKRLLRATAALVFWLLVWQIAAWYVDIELFLPSPADVLRRLAQLGATRAFWDTAFLSLCRVLWGLVWGVLLGFALAGLTCASRWLDALVSPAIRVVRATPVASFILLLFFWTDSDNVPVIVAALMVLPVVWGNVDRGIRERDPMLMELARAYRFSLFKTLRLVVWPSVRPYLFSALITSIGLAWKSGVAAEVLALPKQAIGTHIFNTKSYLDTTALFAWTLVVILLSFLMERIATAVVRRLERRHAV